jgi:hypothetical protein
MIIFFILINKLSIFFSCKRNMSVGASYSCKNHQQSLTTLPIAMDTIKAITNHNGDNHCHHHEAPKRSHDKPLKRNEKGRDNQHRSQKPQGGFADERNKGIMRAL